MLNKGIHFLIYNKLVAFILLGLLLLGGVMTSPFDWNVPGIPSNKVAVDAIPDIGENQQIVFTRWDGRSPQDIDNQITYPLTSALLGIPGVKTVRSTSMFGASSIYLIFEENVDYYWSRSRILEKLNSLPSGLLPTGVQPALGPDATALGQIFWYTLEGRTPEGKVTGGWDLHELRSVQDFYVKYGLASADGVSEVASIGGFVREYQVDVDPDKMKQYGITLPQIVKAIKESNNDIGAQTLEINKVEYLVRGLGYLKSVEDLEKAVIKSSEYTAIRIKDVARVSLGPAPRRGMLDKEGAEAVGGIVVARYGANPMEVIQNVKQQIRELQAGMPSKTLEDGTISKLTIVPFYDRSELIGETLNTLNEALLLEILITVLVVVVMVYNLRASMLISGLLPVAVLMVFISMRYFNVDANIVALSGIAIAIGTMVDLGIILCENILKHQEENTESKPINQVVYEASKEVSGAIVTAVLTTIVSFLPVFAMVGAEGKLFRPLAFTKTMALAASVLVALFLIPPFAALIFRKSKKTGIGATLKHVVWILCGILVMYFVHWIGILLVLLVLTDVLKERGVLSPSRSDLIKAGLTVVGITVLLAQYWRPLGFDRSLVINFIFVGAIVTILLGFFWIFQKYYEEMLRMAMKYRKIFLSIPALIVLAGFLIMRNTGREFMPALDEGAFLLMPTSMPHAGVEENREVLQKLDMAVAAIPEVATVVGKAGRAETALDPAPLSMYENIILYKPEYLTVNGSPQRFRVDDDNAFVLSNGGRVFNPNLTSEAAGAGDKAFYLVESPELIPDATGEYYRSWRPEIESPADIWKAVVHQTDFPGVTSAPKLQPIETRLVMLQTGMRAPMGIKIKGDNLKAIEAFGMAIEPFLREVKGVNPASVFADRIVGKPYLLIDLKRDALMRYGTSVEQVQQLLQVAVGGMPLTQTVEGRERYAVRLRYPRELRDRPEDLKNIYINLPEGAQVPLGELADIRYEQGPQMIKSEDSFLVGYVLFDKLQGYAEVDVVEEAARVLEQRISEGSLKIPDGVSYRFTGTYENQLRAQKTLSFIVPLTLVIVFLILYFQFRSVQTSLIIYTGIAVAFGGGFMLLWCYGQPWFLNFSILGESLRDLFQIREINLSVAVWVGFIALFGIATDDGVVMATYLTQTFEKEQPDTVEGIRDAVVTAGNRRIRACLMTTATTILALLPVLTSKGRGSDIMIPMAIPAFGGMLIALITLFVVPVIYGWSMELKIKKAVK